MLPEQWISITPEEGVFKQYKETELAVKCQFQNAPHGSYRIVLSLYIKELPALCLSPESDPLRVQCSKRCTSCEELSTCCSCATSHVDVLVGEVEVWVECTPINVGVSPCVIPIIGGKLRCGDPPTIRNVYITNISTNEIQYEWSGQPESHCNVTVHPSSGSALQCSQLQSKLLLEAVSPGITFQKLTCTVKQDEKALQLLVFNEVEDPTVDCTTYMLDFGSVKRGSRVTSSLGIINTSNLQLMWDIQEYSYDFDLGILYLMERSRLESTRGHLCHMGSGSELVYTLNTRKPGIWFSILELKVVAPPCPHQHPQYVTVLANIQLPQLLLEVPPENTSFLQLSTLYVGIRKTVTVTLRNLAPFPSSFTWGTAVGSDKEYLRVIVQPNTETIPAGGTLDIDLTIMPRLPGIVIDFYIPCFIWRNEEPIALNIECIVQGLQVTFVLPHKLHPEEILWNSDSRIPDELSYSSSSEQLTSEHPTVDSYSLEQVEKYTSMPRIRLSQEIASSFSVVLRSDDLSKANLLPRSHDLEDIEFEDYVGDILSINTKKMTLENVSGFGICPNYVLDPFECHVEKLKTNETLLAKIEDGYRFIMDIHPLEMERRSIMLSSYDVEDPYYVKDDFFPIISDGGEPHFHTYELAEANSESPDITSEDAKIKKKPSKMSKTEGLEKKEGKSKKDKEGNETKDKPKKKDKKGKQMKVDAPDIAPGQSDTGMYASKSDSHKEVQWAVKFTEYTSKSCGFGEEQSSTMVFEEEQPETYVRVDDTFESHARIGASKELLDSPLQVIYNESLESIRSDERIIFKDTEVIKLGKYATKGNKLKFKIIDSDK